LTIFGDKLYEIAKESAILDLTKYEIGNAILKESKVRGIDLNRLTSAWERLLKFFNVITIDKMVEIQRIAVEKGLTFCDASYIYAAEKHNLKLVTEDGEILKSSENAVNLQAMRELKHPKINRI